MNEDYLVAFEEVDRLGQHLKEAGNLPHVGMVFAPYRVHNGDPIGYLFALYVVEAQCHNVAVLVHFTNHYGHTCAEKTTDSEKTKLAWTAGRETFFELVVQQGADPGSDLAFGIDLESSAHGLSDEKVLYQKFGRLTYQRLVRGGDGEVQLRVIVVSRCHRHGRRFCQHDI